MERGLARLFELTLLVPVVARRVPDDLVLERLLGNVVVVGVVGLHGPFDRNDRAKSTAGEL
jgi:hypothetical protein